MGLFTPLRFEVRFSLPENWDKGLPHVRICFPSHHHLFSFMSLAKKLVVKTLRDLTPYQSARRIGGKGQIYLNANESAFSPYQMPEHETWNRYPDFLPVELTKAYANYANVSPKNVLAVRGADEAIDLLIRTYCEPNSDAVRIQGPTYSMYEFVAQAHGVAVETIPLDAQFGLNVTANQRAGADHKKLKIVFICNPNNPTGNLLPLRDITRIAKAQRNRALVVVDEAYIEYANSESLVSLLTEYPNLVIIRTLSKAFALAAIRIGFIIAEEDVLEQINKLIPPYPMPDGSARIGINALSDAGIEYMRSCCEQVIALREKTREELMQLNLVEEVYNSTTNFLLVRFRKAPEAMKGLLNAGIVIRDQTHFAQLPQHLRISIGIPQDIREMLSHLRRL